MADITVTVTSPGLQAFGSNTFGSSTFGGLEPSATSSPGSLSVEANANVDVTGISTSFNIGQVSPAFSSKVLVEGNQINLDVGNESTQANAAVDITGLSLSSSIGSVTASGVIEIGWGGDEWGVNVWGELSGEFVDVGSVSASFDVGSVTTEANADVNVNGIGLQTVNAGVVAGTSALVEQQGFELQIVTGNEEINLGVPVTGISLSNNIGTAVVDEQPLIGFGWGRSYWGDFVWGDAYSTQTGSVSAQFTIDDVVISADANVDVQGQSLSIVTGNEIPKANANVFPTGISLSSDIGQVEALRIQGSDISTGIGFVDISAGGNVFVVGTEDPIDTAMGQVIAFANYIQEVDGFELNTSIENATAFTDVEVSLTGISLDVEIGEEFAFTDVVAEVNGQEITTFIGNETAFTDVTVEVTGQSLTGSLGDVSLESRYSVTGISMSVEVGSVVTQANAIVSLTGIELTTAIASPNIIAWAEVNTGTPVNWVEVDLAA